MDIRRADEADQTAILALARRTLGWDDDPRFTDLFRWKHEDGPWGPSPRWVATEGGKVVGFRVFLPWRFRHPDGSTRRAVRAVDTATDPDHQGRGIFTRLTRHALDEIEADGVDFVFNTPNEKSRPGYLKMGWIELGRPGVAVVPDPRALVRVARARTAAELWSEPCSAGMPVAELLSHRPLATQPGSTVGLATDATPEFREWRYGLGALHYRALALGADPAEGWAVFRVRRRGRAREGAVAELSAPTPRARRVVMRRVLRDSRVDHLLVQSDLLADHTPCIRIPSLAPLVTWRAVNQVRPPKLEELRLTVGDLELF